MRVKYACLAVILAVFIPASFGQQSNSASQAKQISIEEVIQKFAAAESENKTARNNYTFIQDFDITTLGEAGSITGRYHRVSEIVLDNKGNRIEKITFFPPSTLLANVTKEDLQDLGGAQSFGLSLDELPKYQITFLQKEKIDELDTYVFDIKPKRLIKNERYFQGKIWVDDVDLQIVKAAGKAVPDTEDNYGPRFESYRENIDGRYWFPTYVYIDDVIPGRKGGQDTPLRGVVKFKNYKKFSTNIRVLDEGGEVPPEESKETDKSKPAQPTTEKKSNEKKTDEKKTEPKKPEPLPKKPPVN
jgi:hypothetical protein